MNLKPLFPLTILFVLAAFSAAFAQPEVPAAVQTAFSAKFPQAQKLVWEAEEGEFEAEFRQKGKEMSANFASNGDWLETETAIKVKKLSPAIKAAISAQFPGYEISEAELLEKPGMSLAYELELENKATDSEMEVVIDAAGTVLKQEMEEEADDDNE